MSRMKTIPANDKTKVMAILKWPRMGKFSIFNFNKLVTPEEINSKVAEVCPGGCTSQLFNMADRTLINGDIRRTILYVFEKA